VPLATSELNSVARYLKDGVQGNKRKLPHPDRVDALIAALSSLPFARNDYLERLPETLGPESRMNYGGDVAEVEGCFMLVE